MATEIEKWIRSMVTNQLQVEINNRRIASRAWVVERIQKHTNNLRAEFNSFLNLGIEPPCQHTIDEEARNFTNQVIHPKRNWTSGEAEFLRNDFNEFLNEKAITLKRSPASIKAKLFRLLQQSYGSI